jgi:imidazolonepropionase-like amidohydrolase
VAANLPVLWQRGLKAAEIDLQGKKLTTYRGSYQRMLDMTLALHRAGVPLVAGTDGWAGLGLHRELALYVKAGIPALEALRIGTWNGARVAGESATRGRIARGYAADLVLVDGDPAADITTLRRAVMVFQGQVAYLPAQLYEAQGYKPFVPGAEFLAP